MQDHNIQSAIVNAVEAACAITFTKLNRQIRNAFCIDDKVFFANLDPLVAVGVVVQHKSDTRETYYTK
jgi:hypothetical protein